MSTTNALYYDSRGIGRGMVSRIPWFLQIINLIVLIIAFLTSWLPNKEMPYHPLLLIPSLGIAIILYFYHSFITSKFAPHLKQAQMIWIVALLILITLAVIFPKRTCCERAKWNWAFVPSTCDASTNEIFNDGIWSTKLASTESTESTEPTEPTPTN